MSLGRHMATCSFMAGAPPSAKAALVWIGTSLPMNSGWRRCGVRLGGVDDVAGA